MLPASVSRSWCTVRAAGDSHQSGGGTAGLWLMSLWCQVERKITRSVAANCTRLYECQSVFAAAQQTDVCCSSAAAALRTSPLRQYYSSLAVPEKKQLCVFLLYTMKQ